jgi:hypothetical protein
MSTNVAKIRNLPFFDESVVAERAMADQVHLKRDAVYRLKKALDSIDEVENIIKRFNLHKQVLISVFQF